MRTLGQAIEQAIEQAWGLADQIEAEEGMASIARANIAAREGEGLEPHWQDVAAAENHERAAAWCRELRARRIAMGREPDDEMNAPTDMCCCGRQFADGWARPPQFWDGCPLHPRPAVREKVDEAIRRVRPHEHDGSTGAEPEAAAEDYCACITKRVAVDIPGEDERIRQLMRGVEHALRSAVIEVNRRAAREGRVIAGRPDDGLGDSPRSVALQFASDSLERAAEQLTAALVSTGTMTDEPPF